MPCSCCARRGPLVVLLLLALGSALPAGGQETAATIQFNAALGANNRGVYELAEPAWLKFLADFKTDPRVDRAHYHLGYCYLQQNKLDQAMANYQTVIAKYPASALLESAYFNLGVTQYRLGRAGKEEMFDKAAETFNASLSKYPQGKHTAEVLYFRGEACYFRKNIPAAAQMYGRLVKEYPEHRLAANALFNLGVAQEELKQHEAAGRTYDDFLKRFASHALVPDVTLRRGETFFAAEQYETAGKWFASAASREGFADRDLATMRQATALARLKRYEEAGSLYKSVATEFPKSTRIIAANLAGGRAYFLAKKLSEARPLLDGVVNAGGTPAVEAAHWIAESLLAEKKPAEALAMADKVLPHAAQSAYHAELLLDKADALYEIDASRGKAIAVYADVAKQFPQNAVAPEALYMAAFASLKTGDYRGAITHARTFLAAHAADPYASIVMGVAAEANHRLNEFAEARRLYELLLSKYPTAADAELWKVRLGLILYSEKNYQGTIDALQSALPQIHKPELLAQAHYLLGNSRLALKQNDPAIVSLEASLAAKPDWLQADETLLVLTSAYRRSGKLELARKSVEKMLAQFPRSTRLDEAHYQLAACLHDAKDYPAAATEYQRVVTDWPASSVLTDALFGLGWVQFRQRGFAESAATFTRLIDKHPQYGKIPQARYARGRARHELKQFAPAIEDIQALLAASPSRTEKSEAAHVLGLCQMGLKKPADAVTTFRAILAEHPEYGDADKVYAELAWALKAAGQKKEATETFTQLVVKFPESPLVAESSYWVAEAEFEAGNYPVAAVAYSEARKRTKDLELAEKACYKLGWSYFRQGQPEKFQRAADWFAFQCATYPAGKLASDGAFMQGECYFKLEKFADALQAYNRVKAPTGKDFRMLAMLHASEAAGLAGNWTDSLARIKQCIAQFPDSPLMSQMLFAQGRAQKELKQYDQALTSLQAIIDTKTTEEIAARAMFMIGEVHFDMGKHADAVMAFYKVDVYGYPKWQANALYEAAVCLEVMKKPTQAIKQYQEVIEKHPNSDRAPDARARLKNLTPGE